MTNPANTLIAEFRAAAEEIERILAPSACAMIAGSGQNMGVMQRVCCFRLTGDRRGQRPV